MKHQIKYALDVQTKTSVYERTVTQNDTIEFIITMLMGGEKMDLTNVTPSLAVKRLDGTVTVLDGTVDGNVITFNLGSSETAKPGRTQAVVQLYDDNGRVSSLPFSFCVSADFTAAGFTPSENERTLIEVVLQDGPGILDRAERVVIQNETHFKGVFATVTERDAAVTSPTHGDTATVADESTGISTTYRYVDAAVDTSEAESGWKERDRWKNATAINNLNQQLAETEDKQDLIGWELANKIRKPRPLITFIDDDGRIDVLTKLKPLADKYNIPYTVAAYVDAVQNPAWTQYMSPSDLVMLQNAGWEISSHTFNHLNLSTLTDSEQEYELRHSKEVLEKWGLKVDTICYPYDGRNNKTYEIARKYYRSARRSYGGVNTVPIETYEMRSTCLGSWFDTQGSSPHPTNSLEYYKYQVDQAIANNGWTIFLTHCADPNHDATQQQHLEETIKYAISKGVSIVNYRDGLDIMGNIIDTGHYSKVDTRKKHFVIGADGTVSATDIQDRMKKTEDNAYSNATKPKEIPFEKIFVTRVSSTNATGFPNDAPGTLITNTVNGYAAGYPYVYQEFHVYNSNEYFKRIAASGEAWGPWEAQKAFVIQLPMNSVTATTKPSEIPFGKMNVSRVSGSNTAGFPNNASGTLITNSISGYTSGLPYIYQEFHPYGSSDGFKRVATTSDGWSPWVSLVAYIVNLPVNSVTPAMLASEYINNKISVCRITLAAATGFPSNLPGVLTTNRMGEGSGYTWQEYDVYNSWRKFKRYCQADGQWSAWKEFTMA